MFHLIGVVSGLFWPFQTYCGLLLVVPLFTSDEVAKCFDLQIYYKSISTKECKCYYKRERFFELQSGASGRKRISISTLIEIDLIHYLQMRTCTS